MNNVCSFCNKVGLYRVGGRTACSQHRENLMRKVRDPYMRYLDAKSGEHERWRKIMDGKGFILRHK